MKYIIWIFFLTVITIHCYSQQFNQIDSLKRELFTVKEDTVNIDIQLKIAMGYIYTEPDSSMTIALNALTFSQKINYIKGEAQSLNIIGIVNDITGNQTRALQKYLEAIKLCEKISYPKGIGAAYTNIANIYRTRSDYRKALEYSSKGKEIFEQTKDTAGMIAATIGISENFMDLNILDSSLFYANQAYFWARTHNYLSLVGNIERDIGVINWKLGNTELSLSFLRTAIEKSLISKNYVAAYDTYYNMAYVFKEKKQIDSSIYYSKKGLECSQNINYLEGTREVSKLLSDLYEPEKKDSVIKYMKLYISSNDSLFVDERERNLQNLFYLEQERQQELLQETLRAKADRKSNLQYLIISIVIVFVFLVLYILYYSKIKRSRIKYLGVFALLLVFEFISLFIHPFLIELFGHNQLFIYLCLVGLACFLIPLHTKAEDWITKKLAKKAKRPAKPKIIKPPRTK